jgi:hypothetical protein
MPIAVPSTVRTRYTISERMTPVITDPHDTRGSPVWVMSSFMDVPWWLGKPEMANTKMVFSSHSALGVPGCQPLRLGNAAILIWHLLWCWRDTAWKRARALRGRLVEMSLSAKYAIAGKVY